MSEEKREEVKEETKEEAKEEVKLKQPRLFRNYISFAGAAIAFASFLCILFLFFLELTGPGSSLYLGLFTYIVFPSLMVFGFAVILLGMYLERRRRRRLSPEEIAAFPRIDLNNPQSRRKFFVFLGLTFLFIFMSAYGSYRAFEYTESVAFCGTLCHNVMKPEYVAYQASPHARVRCVDCHVGPGADWYVRSKLSGAYQLYSVTFEKYSRPITTPVHNLRPAQDTCEQCHWPEKFFGAQLKVFNNYAYDEKNTLRQSRMLLNTGGGSPTTGNVAGIHWHMNIANEITYFAADEQRQVIPWVHVKDRQGNVTEYVSTRSTYTPQQIEAAPKRRMDCVDCHNRPSHIYLPPDDSVNRSLAAGTLDPSLPYLKKQAVEILSKPYTTTEEAVAAIGSGLNDFYRTNYPEVYAQKADSIKASITEVQRIYQTYFFPEMKTDWKTHPNNIGHYYFIGCFRCHDGEHVSNTGKVIKNDCNICHTMLDQSEATPASPPFKHPVELGDLANLKCTVCHVGNKPFKHPVDLGTSFTQFNCVDCHAGKVWSRPAD